MAFFAGIVIVATREQSKLCQLANPSHDQIHDASHRVTIEMKELVRKC